MGERETRRIGQGEADLTGEWAQAGDLDRVGRHEVLDDERSTEQAVAGQVIGEQRGIGAAVGGAAEIPRRG